MEYLIGSNDDRDASRACGFSAGRAMANNNLRSIAGDCELHFATNAFAFHHFDGDSELEVGPVPRPRNKYRHTGNRVLCVDSPCVYRRTFLRINRLYRPSPGMRTNIDIDDQLIHDVLKATGLKTKEDAVELGLRTLLRLKKQENIRNFRGKLHCTGDLDDMRTNS